MKKKLLTQKNIASILVPVFSIEVILNLLLYSSLFTEKYIRVTIAAFCTAVCIGGFLLILAMCIFRKEEKFDELTLINRCKSISLTGIIFFAALMLLYVFSWYNTFTLTINMYIICAIISLIIVIEEVLFLIFDHTPADKDEEK